MSGPIFEELSFVSVEDTLVEVASADPGRVIRAILAAALESPDSAWVEACAISLTLTAHPGVCRAALLALGHLARRFGVLNARALTGVLERLEPVEELRGVINDLRDDLHVYGMDI
jgi:hypothetical protein